MVTTEVCGANTFIEKLPEFYGQNLGDLVSTAIRNFLLVETFAGGQFKIKGEAVVCALELHTLYTAIY